LLTAEQRDEFRATGLLRLDEDGRIQRYMNDGTVIDGVPLRVVELTGEPGDIVRGGQ